jgi:hypothetical protein
LASIVGVDMTTARRPLDTPATPLSASKDRLTLAPPCETTQAERIKSDTAPPLPRGMTFWLELLRGDLLRRLHDHAGNLFSRFAPEIRNPLIVHGVPPVMVRDCPSVCCIARHRTDHRHAPPNPTSPFKKHWRRPKELLTSCVTILANQSAARRRRRLFVFRIRPTE